MGGNEIIQEGLLKEEDMEGEIGDEEIEEDGQESEMEDEKLEQELNLWLAFQWVQ